MPGVIDAIPDDAAIAPIKAVLRNLVDGHKPAGGIAAVLYGRVIADDQALLAALRNVEQAYEFYDLGRLLADIRTAMRLMRQIRPELVERLRQRISDRVSDGRGATGRCQVGHRDHEKRRLLLAVIGAGDRRQWSASVGGSILGAVCSPCGPRKDVCRIQRGSRHGMAAHCRSSGELVVACSGGGEDSAIEMRIISGYYLNQPAEIMALKPASDQAVADAVLEPGRAYRQAAMIQPDAETFQKWWAWAQRVDLPVKQKEDIAKQWQRSRPRDVLPLVILSSLAESRALSLAIKRLGEAETIDSLNQQVRQARVRLTMSITWRHFADGKAHLVEKDLAELEALPGMGEGDRVPCWNRCAASGTGARGSNGGGRLI